MKREASFIYVTCECGEHLVDTAKLTGDTSFYHCDQCLKPLVVKGMNDRYYTVGDRIL